MSADRWIDEVVPRSLLPAEEPPSERPSWASRLLHATAGASDTSPEDDELTLPFGSVWAPLVAHAQAAVARHETSGMRVHGSVLAGQRAWLLSELASLGLPVLMHEFTRYRNGAAAAGCRQSSAAYRAFTARLEDGGLIELLRRYPVWARMVGCRLDHTIASTRRLLDRWVDDRRALAQRCPGASSHAVEAVELGLSDPHGGGQTVGRLDLADGTSLYAKPRGIWSQRALNTVLARLHHTLGEPPPPPMRMLCRDDHGWVVGTPQRRVDSREALAAFHRRAGVLLFALYLLGLTDVHADNVVAHGAFPVVIDAECLLAPSLRADVLAGPLGPSSDSRFTVGHTGLLPRWARDERGRWYSQAGLTDPRPFEPRRGCWVVDGCNTDGMICRRGWTRGNTGANVPWTGAPLLAEPTRARLVAEGFGQAYDAFLRDASGLGDLVIELARPLRSRLVVRPTAHYVALAQQLGRPEALTCGAAAERTLEPLRRAFAPRTPALRHAVARLVAVEMRDLVEGDVPRFGVDTSRGTVTGARGTDIDGLLGATPLKRLRSRIAALHPTDRDRQAQVIRAAFRTAPGRRGHAGGGGSIRARAVGW